MVKAVGGRLDGPGSSPSSATFTTTQPGKFLRLQWPLPYPPASGNHRSDLFLSSVLFSLYLFSMIGCTGSSLLLKGFL